MRFANHYRGWAQSFHELVKGRIGCVEGELIHLWHGHLKDRLYRTRFEQLARFDFDPKEDLALDAQDCWRWGSTKPELHAFVRDMFFRRHEDGDTAMQQYLLEAHSSEDVS